MYQVKKKVIYGYAFLPCFKMRAYEFGEEAELVCNNFLSTIFELFFAPFYDGRIRVTKVVEE